MGCPLRQYEWDTVPPEFNIEGGARKCVVRKSHCSGCDTGGGSGKEGDRRQTRLGGRLRLSGAGPIETAPQRVAGVFAAQGVVRSAQNPRQRAQRLSLGQAQTHGLQHSSVCSIFVMATL